MPDRLRDDAFFAHSQNDAGTGVPETLLDHLRLVADTAAKFASAFDVEDQACAAGLCHDLGKYADQFQKRLRDPNERSRDHWTAGAALLISLFGQRGLIPALAVAAHHTGLGQFPSRAKEFGADVAAALKAEPGQFTETKLRILWERFTQDGFQQPSFSDGLVPSGSFAADMLDVRMFFSALVDADFLETEAHFEGDAQTPRRPRPPGPALDIPRAVAAFDSYVVEIRRQFAHAPMAASREVLLRACIDAAAGSQGLFSLSAPTGSGKTLAMLAFALHHALKHGLRRIVLVMPFLNIIEQAAAIYYHIFSEENGFSPNTVLEHHSLAGHHDDSTVDVSANQDDSRPTARLLAENWDAPVILTTSVQLLQSLMANRPGRCRKLHRLARSVILFDEVQTLPLGLAVATLATLSRLADPSGPYRSTVLFATATQPAFHVLDERVCKEFASSGWRPREMVPDAEALFAEASGRVHVCWRHTLPIGFDELAEELMKHEQVLAIVNLKRHAVQLATALRERGATALLHLSTNMCPAHRTKVLRRVNKRLRGGRPIRLVSTQCVEAGVDLDFPVVYRALAPLEAVAQAAGRCNRHGSRPTGSVVVFKPRDDRSLYPPGYRQAVNATEVFLAGLAGGGSLDDIEIINHPERLQAYFRQFYSLAGRETTEGADERELLEAIRAGDFAEVARLYRLIREDAINVLVPYDEAAFEQLCAELAPRGKRPPGFAADWFRRAVPYAVSLFRPPAHAELWNLLEPVQFGRRPLENYEADWFTALPGLGYDPLFGLDEASAACWIA